MLANIHTPGAFYPNIVPYIPIPQQLEVESAAPQEASLDRIKKFAPLIVLTGLAAVGGGMACISLGKRLEINFIGVPIVLIGFSLLGCSAGILLRWQAQQRAQDQDGNDLLDPTLSVSSTESESLP